MGGARDSFLRCGHHGPPVERGNTWSGRPVLIGRWHTLDFVDYRITTIFLNRKYGALLLVEIRSNCASVAADAFADAFADAARSQHIPKPPVRVPVREDSAVSRGQGCIMYSRPLASLVLHDPGP